MSPLLLFPIFFPPQFGGLLDEGCCFLWSACAHHLEFFPVKLVVSGEEKRDLGNYLFVQLEGLKLRRRLLADGLADDAIVASRFAVLGLCRLDDRDWAHMQKTTRDQGFFVQDKDIDGVAVLGQRL